MPGPVAAATIPSLFSQSRLAKADSELFGVRRIRERQTIDMICKRVSRIDCLQFAPNPNGLFGFTQMPQRRCQKGTREIRPWIDRNAILEAIGRHLIFACDEIGHPKKMYVLSVLGCWVEPHCPLDVGDRPFRLSRVDVQDSSGHDREGKLGSSDRASSPSE